MKRKTKWLKNEPSAASAVGGAGIRCIESAVQMGRPEMSN